MSRARAIRIGTIALTFGMSLGVSSFAKLASACPSCPVGQTARKQVFEQDFATNAAAGILPFFVVGLVAKRAERIGRRPQSKGEA